MNRSNNLQNLGYCGVDCSVCADFTQGKCPSCRGTQWKNDDICHPVKCCREKGIAVCGQCIGFPCDMMTEFYEESDSHREAGERMRQISEENI